METNQNKFSSKVLFEQPTENHAFTQTATLRKGARTSNYHKEFSGNCVTQN